MQNLDWDHCPSTCGVSSKVIGNLPHSRYSFSSLCIYFTMTHCNLYRSIQGCHEMQRNRSKICKSFGRQHAIVDSKVGIFLVTPESDVIWLPQYDTASVDYTFLLTEVQVFSYVCTWICTAGKRHVCLTDRNSPSSKTRTEVSLPFCKIRRENVMVVSLLVMVPRNSPWKLW